MRVRVSEHVSVWVHECVVSAHEVVHACVHACVHGCVKERERVRAAMNKGEEKTRNLNDSVKK